MRLVRSTSLLAVSSVLALAGCGSDEPAPAPAPTPTVVTPRVTPPPAHTDDDPLDARPVLACGPWGQGSHAFAHELQEQGKAANVAFSILPAADSLDVLYLVALGHADLGVVHADVLLSPLHAAARAAVEVVRPIGVEPLRVFVTASSPARALTDLDGKRIALGPVGSAAATTGREVLIAAGLDPDAPEVRHLAADAALAALGRGEVDAALVLGNPPGGLDRASAGSRELPLTAETLTALKARAAFYGEVLLEGGAGKTVSVPAVLVARKGAATQPVRELLDALQGAAELARDLGPSLQTPIDGPEMEFPAAGAALRLGSSPASDGLVRAAAGLTPGVQIVACDGPIDALALLASGQLDLAVVPEDLVQELLSGPATAPLVARVRLASPLGSTQVQLAGHTPDMKLEGLRGKKVGFGLVGSSTSISARRMLREAGLGRGDVVGRSIGGRAAETALGSGALDGAVLEGGEILDAAGVQIALVDRRDLLLCRRDLEPKVVQALLQAIYSNRKNLEALGRPSPWTGLDPANLVAPAQGLKAHEGLTAAAAAGVTADDAPAW